MLELVFEFRNQRMHVEKINYQQGWNAAQKCEKQQREVSRILNMLLIEIRRLQDVYDDYESKLVFYVTGQQSKTNIISTAELDKSIGKFGRNRFDRAYNKMKQKELENKLQRQKVVPDLYR